MSSTPTLPQQSDDLLIDAEFMATLGYEPVPPELVADADEADVREGRATCWLGLDEGQRVWLKLRNDPAPTRAAFLKTKRIRLR